LGLIDCRVRWLRRNKQSRVQPTSVSQNRVPH
jgi:hypothetical protein